MGRHRLVRAVLGIAVVLGLAGCTPDPHPYIAVTIVDDRPTLLVAECARTRIEYVTLSERDDSTSPSPGRARHEWSVASPLSTPGPDGVRNPTAVAPARITFFVNPPSWLVRSKTLRAFREDTEYRVDSGVANVGSLTFTLARLRKLEPGKVITAVGYLDQHAVSEADFEKAARKDCDRP